jgi:hypothetical protein
MIARAIAAAAVIVGSLTGVHRAEAGHTAFALVVTNNHGGALGRPDLQYADDDAARYYELFATLAPADHIALLTDFDRDTARLFPALVPIASSPSRANVAAAARAITSQVAAARRAGDTVDLYFVFAGHGDVDRGRGFLQLTDGVFAAADLETLVGEVHATHAHVILDSCNSFFVVNPRRPGGRRFATPADAVAGLAQRSADVGVFVSTSAEAEVFEWSALQSGVFSHAVRSGLAGAADANHDGAISYNELRAFVDTATAEIKNSAFRPKVYARGPGGDDAAALVAAGDGGMRLTLEAARPIRLTIRDRDELPWIDLHKEAGTPLTLRLPSVSVSADERDAHGAVQRREIPAPGPAAPATAELGDLELAISPPAPRAADDPFRALFARPFGPAALARHDAERAAEPPPVFGIARDDATRLAQLLDEVDEAQAQQRRINASYAFAGAAFELGFAAFADLSSANRQGQLLTRGLAIGLGVGFVALGTIALVRRPESERLRESLVSGLASGRDPARVVAEVDDRLHAAARTERRLRIRKRWIGGILLSLAVGLYATDRALDHRLSSDASAFNPAIAAGAAVGAIRLLDSFSDTPIERTVRLWDREPTLAGVGRIAVTPVTGGATVSLGGRF